MEVGVLRRDGRTDPFFDGAAADRLVIRRCRACARWYAPDVSECAGCGAEPEWAEASGRAALVSWAFAHGRPGRDGPVAGSVGASGPTGTGGPEGTDRPEGAGGSAAPPAVLALVELAEGPWLYSRLDGVARAALREGLPLRARFAHPAEGESYVVFRASPASPGAPGTGAPRDVP